MSAERVLADSGPLVAVFSPDDAHHAACVRALKDLRGPLFTVWPAVTEAMYLLSFSPKGQEALLWWLESGSLKSLEIEVADIARSRELMRKYQDLPMDFTDAVVVSVAEREDIRCIFTIDRRDFGVYRPKHAARFHLLPER